MSMPTPKLQEGMMDNASPTIQAGIQKAVVIQPEKTFQQVKDENKEIWPQLSPDQVQKAADVYLKKYVEPLPGFKQLNDEQRNNFYTEFNKKYDVGHVQADFQDIGNLATLNIPANAIDAATMGTTDFANQTLGHKFDTDPGLYGEAARLSQNPIVKGIGGLAGSLAGTGGIVNQVEQSGLGLLGSAAAAGNKFLAPWLGTAEKAAFSGGATAWNALNHGMSSLRGEETPQQALMSLGLDTAALGAGGQTRLGNAAAQGAAGAASSVGSNLIHGQNPNWGRAAQEGLTQAGVGAALHHTESRPEKAQELPKAEPAQPKEPPAKVDRKQQAIDIHNALNSNDPQRRVKAKELLAQIKVLSKDKRSSVNQAKIRKPGDQGAKEILAHLEMHTQDLRKETGKRIIRDKEEHERLAQKAVKYRAKGGKIAATFENYLDRHYSREDKRIINARVKEIRGEDKAQVSKETERARIRREQGQKKVTAINQTRQKQTIEQKRAESDRIKREKEKQKQEMVANKKREASGRHIADMLHGLVEDKEKPPAPPTKTDTELRTQGPDEYKRMAQEAKKKTAPKKIKHVIEPDVLDNADIERLSNELVAHREKNEKETLSAKLIAHRSAARLDHTRNGATPERSEAIRTSHQKLLDAYNQKSSETQRKPSAIEMKAGQEANRLELSKLNNQGGKYAPGDKTATQRPARGFTLEEIKKTQEWDRLDADTKKKAEAFMEAAKIDGHAILEYDAERSGDTGQYKLKTVAPLSLDITGDSEDPHLVGYATNQNGHTGTYYLSPSKPNQKTGFSSYTHDVTLLPESEGKAKQGLDANAYHGQRPVAVSDILNRPIRKTAGYTSETEAIGLQGMEGKNVHDVRKALKKAAKNGKKSKLSKSAETVQGMAEQSHVVQSTISKSNENKIDPEAAEALSGQLKKSKGKGRKKIAEDTGC